MLMIVIYKAQVSVRSVVPKVCSVEPWGSMKKFRGSAGQIENQDNYCVQNPFKIKVKPKGFHYKNLIEYEK
jgi:hypothetical protein